MPKSNQLKIYTLIGGDCIITREVEYEDGRIVWSETLRVFKESFGNGQHAFGLEAWGLDPFLEVEVNNKPLATLFELKDPSLHADLGKLHKDCMTKFRAIKSGLKL